MTGSNNLIRLPSSELALRESSLITRGLELLQTKKSILIFDEYSMCNVLERILYDDYTIYRTNKKEELSIILNVYPIDVFITDVRYFGENWTTEIRSVKHSYPNVKIFNLSQYNDIILMIELINVNYSETIIDGMLPKPFETDMLRDKIQAILSVPDTIKQEKQSRRKMLISDDEDMFVWVCTKFIKDSNFPVDIDGTHCTKETKKMIESEPNKYDLFTTDYGKPEISGLELAKLVRKISPKTKIIICSGGSGLCLHKNFLEEILENQLIDYYMTKPIEKEEYLHVISKLLDL